MTNAAPARTFASLTGLRGVGALWVLLTHIERNFAYLHIGPQWVTHLAILRTGWSALDFFFIVSGFVLMHVHGGELAQPDARQTIAFFKLRIARVYPLNAVVLFLLVPLVLDATFVAAYQQVDTGNFGLLAFVKTLVLATRWWLPGTGEWNGVVWSLSVEVLGYAAFPLLAWAVMSIRSPRRLIALAVATLAIWTGAQWAQHLAPGDPPNADQLRMACGFIVGAVMARLCTLAPQVVERFAVPLSIAAVAGVFLCVSHPRAMALAPPCYAMLIFALSAGRGPVDWALSTRAAMYFGNISFPLYLIHSVPLMWICVHLARAGSGPAFVTACMAVYAIVIIGLAYALHRFVEVPSRRFGRRWVAAGDRRLALEPLPVAAVSLEARS